MENARSLREIEKATLRVVAMYPPDGHHLT
jgi:hypothetical protein